MNMDVDDISLTAKTLPVSPSALDASVNCSPPTRSISISSRPSLEETSSPTATKNAGHAFRQLPQDIIELILWLSDVNTFASLVFLNRNWNMIAQNAPLYAHHLSRCPSYALAHDVITTPSRLNDLAWLKAKFAQEVRRNLFDAFMRPSETLVNLIATSTSSSAAFPRGEALRFVFSNHGQTLLALSSSRIFVMNLHSDPFEVTRELKTMRRALGAAITNDGSLLAVLSTKYQVNIYGLTDVGVVHLQVILLDNPPRTIALSNEGTVLAAAYDGGVEVFSLAVNALSTDRRAVRCEALDSLSFSGDGSMLIGSSADTDESNTVVITAPFYTENDPDLTTRDIHSRMWTTQILFPQNSSTCNYAALLNAHGEGDVSWLFVHDRTLNTYRAVRADDTRSGVAYFLGPKSGRFSIPLPNLLPSVDLNGELAVAGFSGAGIFIYGIPERVDNAPDMSHVLERNERTGSTVMGSLTSATGYREPLMAFSPPLSDTDSIEDDILSGSVDWRQSIFIRSRKLPALEEAIGVTWVEKVNQTESDRIRRRLAVVAPGGVSEFAEDVGDEFVPVDGGRILLLDFDYSPSGPRKKAITIEVGEKEPEMLPEQRGNLDAEVALARRRSIRETVTTSRRLSLGHAATANYAQLARMSTHFEDTGSRGSISQPSSPVDLGNAADAYAASGFQTPRAHPRSRDSVQRAVTTAGISRARYPARPPLGSQQSMPTGNAVHGRTNERRSITASSEGDNWEAPPPYRRSPDQNPPDPNRFQMGSKSFTDPTQRMGAPFHSPQRASTAAGDRLRPATSSNAMQHHQVRSGQFTVHPGGFPTPIHSPQQRNDQYQRMQSPVSLMSSVSPQSPPWAPMRRPSEPSVTMVANITSPMGDVSMVPRSTEITPPANYVPNPMAPSFPSPSPDFNERAPATLTGANLQNRLNHPVPPRPSPQEEAASQVYIPNTLQVGSRGLTGPMPGHPYADQYPFVPPNSNQVSSLHRRLSGARNHQPPLGPAGQQMHGMGNQDFAHTGPPPRGAWGAAGVPGVPSFNQALRSPQGLSRNNSRGSQYSASMPNLSGHNRPRPGRLDTIESIRSILPSRDRPGTGSRSAVEQSQMVSPFQMQTASNSRPPKGRKQRRSDQVQNDGSMDGKKKGGSRCTIM